ncbi:polysaccharide deacetylase family protein [Virgibacillus sp. W0181]|uniref:polysaccharide deacetylase family protein n=1 Tax=Virgibacillus sp. W0181 TaxID=3391581 RepID=UPI003F48C11E
MNDLKRYVLLYCLLFVLVACSGQTDSNENANEDVAVEEQEQEQEQQADKAEDQQDEQENADPSAKQGNEEGQLEEKERNIEPKYTLNNKTWSVEPLNEEINEQVVLLTIDDAPDKYALEMANTLKELDAPAIFFVNGHFLETTEEKEILKKIHDMGFEIGNHTYSHQQLSDLSEEEQREEIIRVNDMVEEIIGKRPKYFRAPFGVNTDFSKQLAKEEGMMLMNWSYGYDWNKEYMSKEAIADIMVNAPELGNGANLLMHDREWTEAALEDIVKGLRNKGYETMDPSLIETK